jgi:glutathione S-transferase
VILPLPCTYLVALASQHHLNNSRSQRILWLLEELNVTYEIKHYKRGADRRAPKSLREVHPLGKSPLITTEEGRVIAESGTICGE